MSNSKHNKKDNDFTLETFERDYKKKTSGPISIAKFVLIDEDEEKENELSKKGLNPRAKEFVFRLISRKSSRKSRKTSRKSRKTSRKSRRTSRKSRRVSRKSRKTSRKSRRVSRKSRRVSRKSRRVYLLKVKKVKMPYKILPYTLEKAKHLGVTIKNSSNPKKKIDVFKNGKKIASIGAIGFLDYPHYLEQDKQLAEDKKKAYKARHEKDRKKVGSNGWWADNLLW